MDDLDFGGFRFHEVSDEERELTDWERLDHRDRRFSGMRQGICYLFITLALLLGFRGPFAVVTEFLLLAALLVWPWPRRCS